MLNLDNGRDDGVDRETRTKACTRTTWCFFEAGHEGICKEAPRSAYERPLWDLKSPDPRGWRQVKGK